MNGGRIGDGCTWLLAHAHISHTSHTTRHTSHVTRHTPHVTRCIRAVYAQVLDEEEELIKWYCKAESIAAEVAVSTQKTRDEYAAKAAGHLAAAEYTAAAS